MFHSLYTRFSLARQTLARRWNIKKNTWILERLPANTQESTNFVIACNRYSYSLKWDRPYYVKQNKWEENQDKTRNRQCCIYIYILYYDNHPGNNYDFFNWQAPQILHFYCPWIPRISPLAQLFLQLELPRYGAAYEFDWIVWEAGHEWNVDTWMIKHFVCSCDEIPGL